MLGFAAILAAASLGLPAHAAAAPPGALKALDTDNDGTVDLAEAKAAASKLFDKLDRDHDGTLDRRELGGRMVSKELGAADGDHDGTLDKDEYLAFVEKSFRAADRDNDRKRRLQMRLGASGASRTYHQRNLQLQRAKQYLA